MKNIYDDTKRVTETLYQSILIDIEEGEVKGGRVIENQTDRCHNQKEIKIKNSCYYRQ
jgi:hypothetical protein